MLFVKLTDRCVFFFIQQIYIQKCIYLYQCTPIFFIKNYFVCIALMRIA